MPVVLNRTAAPSVEGSSRKVAAERLVPLDGLRLFAALAVLGFRFVSRGAQFWHLPGGANPFPQLHRVTAYGWMGVDLFFIISGFVICMSSWGRGLGSFFVSRATRLYPAYWAGILITTVVLTILPCSSPSWSGAFGIVGFSLLLAVRAVRGRLPGFGSMAGAELGAPVAGGIVVLFFAIVLAIALGWFDWMRWRWLVPAGELTYPLYLIHGYAGYALISHYAPRTNRYALLGALVAGMLFAAWLIAHLIERPMARAMRRGPRRALNHLRREGSVVPRHRASSAEAV